MITHIFYEMFDWPQGIVVGNLIASFMIWSPHFIYVHRKINKLHDAIRKVRDND